MGQLASNAVRLMPKVGLGAGQQKDNGVGHGAKVMDRLREQVNAQKGRKSTQDYLDKSSKEASAAASKAETDAEELARAREEIAALQAADSEIQEFIGSTSGSLAGGGATGLEITRTALQIGTSVAGSGSGSGSGNRMDSTQRIN